MRYSFDQEVSRHDIDSMKWDVPQGSRPMWVADMDLQTAPVIIEALQERVKQGTFGYTLVSDQWREAYQTWWKENHGWTMEKDWLLFCTGVVPALSSIVRRVTHVGENVLVCTPVYNIFFNSILNNGRRVLESPLLYQEGQYVIDFEDLEKKLADPQTSLFLLCNPHNPVGKIWSREELERIACLCEKYHVLVCSDEIHCDLTQPQKDYVPYGSVSRQGIICLSASKAFNLAGLQSAAVVIADPVLRHKVNRGLNNDEIAEPNVFATLAPIVAFEKGKEWLDALRAYLWENRKTAEDFIARKIPEISVIKAQATYLLWIDARTLTQDSTALVHFLEETQGLYLSDGNEYHNGSGFLRMNLACSRQALMDGLERLRAGIQAF